MSGSKRRGVLLDDNDPALFPKLTDEQMDLLARHGKVRPTQSGEVLFRGGDATYDVMVLLESTVIITVGKGDSERELAIQRPFSAGAKRWSGSNSESASLDLASTPTRTGCVSSPRAIESCTTGWT